MDSDLRNSLEQRFRQFALEECNDSSPLYAVFALTVADSDELLELASHGRSGQPPANLLFAAVQDVLLRDDKHALREFYPAFVEAVRPCSEAGDHFLDFCRCYDDEIKTLIAARLVQTNEVRRCVYLQEAFATVIERMGERPLALIELGPSAALNLCWDRYDYGFDNWGHVSPVKITTEWRGEKRPPQWKSQPNVVFRSGVDLNVVELENEDERRWLQALIWPEHRERRERLPTAMEIVRQEKIHLEEGDAVERLPPLIAATPAGSLPCVYHTHVANQMSAGQRGHLIDLVDEIGKQRDLCHIHNGIEHHLHLTYYLNGIRHDLPLAHTDGHARWVEWLA